MRFFAIASVLFTAALGVFASPVTKRHPTPISVLTELKVTVTPLAHRLLYATPANATRDVLRPIIGDIHKAVTRAVDGLDKILKHHEDPSAPMLSRDEPATLTIYEIGPLLASIVNPLFTSVHASLKMVNSHTHTAAYEMSTSLGHLVLKLIPPLLILVPGLRGPLYIMLAPTLPIMRNLGLGETLDELFGVSS